MRKIALFALAAALVLAGIGAWASSSTHARVETVPAVGLDVSQITMQARDLRDEAFVDYSLVFN